MKKLLALLLCLIALSACTGTKEPEVDPVVDTDPDPVVAGGWTLSEKIDNVLTAEENDIFEKAMEGFTGQGFEPIALIATQVVSGTNYAFLAKGTLVTAQPVSALKIVKIYKDLEDNCSVLDVVDFDFETFTVDNSANKEQLAGGWTVCEDVPNIALDADAMAAFEEATEGWAGKGFTPIAVLGTQVVAGVNYAFLTRSTLVTAEPIPSVDVVVVYKPAGGTAEIKSVYEIDIASLD